MNKKYINNILINTDLDNNSDLVTIGYVINVGSYNEDESNLGITHLIEHLLFKGTLNRTANEINKYIEKLGGYMNAYTSYTNTKFYCTVPSEYYKEAIEFLNDLIFYNTIPEKEFELEKNVVLNELRMYNDSPQDICYDNLMKLVFNNAINRQLVGGTVETVSKITRQQVIDFIDTYYVNSNINIVITGNIKDDLENLYNYIESITIELQENKYNDKQEEFYFDIKENEVEETKSDILQSILNWCMIGPSKYDEDYYPFMIIINLLGGNMSSIFYEEIREKLGLVYSIGMDVCSEFEEYTLALGNTSLQKENIKKVKDILQNKIYNVHMNKELLEDNKKYLIGSLLRLLETTNGKNSYLTSNNKEYEQEIESINKVTLYDIERVIKKYFKNNDIYYSSIISK